MNFRGHLFSAILVLIVISLIAYPQIASILSITEMSVAAFIFILYSLVPDIDTDSHIQTIVYTAILFSEAYLIYSQKYKIAAILGVLSTIPLIAKHRGFCHSWLFGIVISLPFALVNWIFIIPAFAGFALHKVCDSG
jgi:hypothetical protein